MEKLSHFEISPTSILHLIWLLSLSGLWCQLHVETNTHMLFPPYLHLVAFPKTLPQLSWQFLLFNRLRPFSSSLHSVIGSPLSFSLTPSMLAVLFFQSLALLFLSTHFSPVSQHRGSSSQGGLDWIPLFWCEYAFCYSSEWGCGFSQTMWAQVCERGSSSSVWSGCIPSTRGKIAAVLGIKDQLLILSADAWLRFRDVIQNHLLTDKPTLL